MLRAARASCGSLRPCGRCGCAAPLAALGGLKKLGCLITQRDSSPAPEMGCNDSKYAKIRIQHVKNI